MMGGPDITDVWVRSHKISSLYDRRIRQINPVLRTQTNMTPETYAGGTRNRQAKSLPYN